MDKKTAEELVKAVLLFETPLNTLTAITVKMDDKEEAKKLRRFVAEIMALVTIDLLGSIVEQYPELDPYKDYFKNLTPEP